MEIRTFVDKLHQVVYQRISVMVSVNVGVFLGLQVERQNKGVFQTKELIVILIVRKSGHVNFFN